MRQPPSAVSGFNDSRGRLSHISVQSMKTNSLVFQIKRQRVASPCFAAKAPRASSSARCGIPAQRQAVGGCNSRLQIAAGTFEAAGEFPRLADHEQVIPEGERLQRRQSLAPDRSINIRVRDSRGPP